MPSVSLTLQSNTVSYPLLLVMFLHCSGFIDCGFASEGGLTRRDLEGAC